eukprot:TRINITY_DN6963_c2_g1_i2.p1 TRINITY_DN6963_c2_g1~~TRINITY_DN6963_c2_g1_i2.p1  ORF type:complete len:311 (+),score=16.82 TRINITY_DN6963_c2_g1_i2:65-997(+)
MDEEQLWWEDLEFRALEAAESSPWAEELAVACERVQGILKQLTAAQEGEISALEKLEEVEQQHDQVVIAFKEAQSQIEALSQHVADLQSERRESVSDDLGPLHRTAFVGGAGGRDEQPSPRRCRAIGKFAVAARRLSAITGGSLGSMSPGQPAVRVTMPAPDDEIVGRADVRCDAWEGTAVIAGAIARRCLFSAASAHRRCQAVVSQNEVLQTELREQRNMAQEYATEAAQLRATANLRHRECAQLRERLRTAEKTEAIAVASAQAVGELDEEERLLPCIGRASQLSRELRESCVQTGLLLKADSARFSP